MSHAVLKPEVGAERRRWAAGIYLVVAFSVLASAGLTLGTVSLVRRSDVQRDHSSAASELERLQQDLLDACTGDGIVLLESRIALPRLRLLCVRATTRAMVPRPGSIDGDQVTILDRWVESHPPIRRRWFPQ